VKLTKETLKRIIKEELQAVLNEDGNDAAVRRGVHGLAGSTLGVDAEKQRSGQFNKKQSSAQSAADIDRAVKKEREAAAELARLEKTNKFFIEQLTADIVKSTWYKEAEADWESSKKSREDYNNFERKWNMMGLKWSKGRVADLNSGKMDKQQERLALAWYNAFEQKAFAEKEQKIEQKKSFMQKAKSFIGLQEE
tara:strand:- start:179 stop:763 length:585 start_codon:yes stop_codon:yes gene_type:complete